MKTEIMRLDRFVTDVNSRDYSLIPKHLPVLNGYRGLAIGSVLVYLFCDFVVKFVFRISFVFVCEIEGLIA